MEDMIQVKKEEINIVEGKEEKVGGMK